MRISFRVRKFTFNMPSEISERNFYIIKRELKSNSKVSLFIKDNFIYIFKSELIILLILFSGALLTIINIEWISAIGGFMIIGTIVGLFEFIFSLFSFSDYLLKKNKYYKRLKKDIVHAESYDDFLLIRSLSKK
jgi:hypothetical protein